MNIRKIAKKTKAFLNADERKRKEKRKFLKHVISKLKKHDKAMIRKLETETDVAKRARLEAEVALTHAQRKKGLAKLEELKKTSKRKKESPPEKSGEGT